MATLLPKLRKISNKNKKHIYKMKDSAKKRHLAIDEGVLSESKKRNYTKKKAANAKKARFNVLRIYNKNNYKKCNIFTSDMLYMDKKYKLGHTNNICKKTRKKI